MIRALLVSCLAGAAWGQAPPPAEPLDLPIRAVTVFSDRARVTRRAEVKLAKGPHRLSLGALPPTADGESVSLELTGATLQRVEVSRPDRDPLSPTEAEKALRELEDVRLQALALEQQIDNREAERALLLRLRPAASPVDAKGQPRPLETGGWRDSMQFVEARVRASDDAIAALEKKQRELRARVDEVTARVKTLAGVGDAPPLRVEALVEAPGGAVTLALSYVALGARWYPAYDVRYRAGQPRVELSFAALVSQQTGEDWPASGLTLSTAVPATLRGAPKLPVWKLGEKERFIPTPVAKPRPAPADTQVAQAPPGDPLRARLREALGQQLAELERRTEALKEQIFRSKTRLVLLQETVLAGKVGADESQVERVRALEQQVQAGLDDARREKDVVKVNALNDKLVALRGLRAVAEGAATSAREAEAHGDADRAAHERTKLGIVTTKAEDQAGEARAAVGEQAAEVVVQSERVAHVTLDGLAISGRLAPSEGPPRQIPFVTPRAWQLPSFAADLPAALAGGYDFTFPAAQPEAVKSGATARRVPLHRVTFAAEPELSIVPALSSSAFLMANVVNESSRPLLQGAANLYVGADLVGQATVATTSPGERTRVPLGIDDAVKVERHVDLVAGQSGFFVRSEVSTYDVRIELLSSRPDKIAVRVLDQVPLSGDEKVEVKLLSTEPYAAHDKDDGTLEWRVTLPPGVKQTLRFSYQVSRPAGARLHQW